jgi:hypothetical protein
MSQFYLFLSRFLMIASLLFEPMRLLSTGHFAVGGWWLGVTTEPDFLTTPPTAFAVLMAIPQGF